MRNYFLLLFLFLINLISYAQYDCGWHGTMTIEESRQQFPFNEAKKVILVSYSNKGAGFLKPNDTLSSEPIILHKWEIILDSTNIIYETREEVLLDSKGIDELSSLIFNFKVLKLPNRYVIELMSCYVPRNSILFLNENEDIIAVIEICFECGRVNIYPYLDANLYFEVSGCEEKLSLLKDIFKKYGLTYGVSE